MAVMRAALRVLGGSYGGRLGCLPASAEHWEWEHLIDLTAAERPWRAALAALETDAYAPLP